MTERCPHGLGDILEGVKDLMGDLRECCYGDSTWRWQRLLNCVPWLLDEVPIILNAAVDFIGAFGFYDLFGIGTCLLGQSGVMGVLDMIWTTLHTCGLKRKTLLDAEQVAESCKCEEPKPTCCCYPTPPSSSILSSSTNPCFNFAQLTEEAYKYDKREAVPKCPKISWEGMDGKIPCPRPIPESGKFVEVAHQLSSTKCVPGNDVGEVNERKLQEEQCPLFREGSEDAGSSRCCCYQKLTRWLGLKTLCFNVEEKDLLEGRQCPNMRRLTADEKGDKTDNMYCPSKYGTHSPEAGCSDPKELRTFPKECENIEAGLMEAEEMKRNENKLEERLQVQAKIEHLTADLYQSGCREEVEPKKEGNARVASLQRQAAKTWNRRNVSTAAAETAAMDVGTSDAAEIAAMDVGTSDECSSLVPVLDKFTLFVDKYTACTKAPRKRSFLLSSQLICVGLEKQALAEVFVPLINVIEEVIKVKNGEVDVNLLPNAIERTPQHLLDVLLNCLWRGQWQAGRAKLYDLVRTLLQGWDTKKIIQPLAQRINLPETEFEFSKEESCTCPKAKKNCCCYKELSGNAAKLVHCYDFSALKDAGEDCPRIVMKSSKWFTWSGQFACKVHDDAAFGIAASDMLAQDYCTSEAKAKDVIKITEVHVNLCKTSATKLEEEYKDIADNVICAQKDPTTAWRSDGKCHKKGKHGDHPMNCCYKTSGGEEKCWQYTVKDHIPFRTHLCPPIRWVGDVGCPVWDMVGDAETVEVYPVWWKPDKTGKSFDPWPGTTDICAHTWKSAASALTPEKIPSRTICCRYCRGTDCGTSYKFFTKFHSECPTLKGKCRVDNTYTGLPGTSTACDPESAPLWNKDDEDREAGRVTYCGHGQEAATCCCYKHIFRTANRKYNCFYYRGECPAVYWRDTGDGGKLPCPEDLWPWTDTDGGPEYEAPLTYSVIPPGGAPQFDEEWCGKKMDETSPELAAPRSRRTCCCYKGKDGTTDVCYAYLESSLKANGSTAVVCPKVVLKSGWVARWAPSFPCPLPAGDTLPKGTKEKNVREPEPSDNTKDACETQRGKVPSFSRVMQTWCEKRVNGEEFVKKEKAAECEEKEKELKELNDKANVRDGTYKNYRSRSLARIRQILGAKRGGRATGSGTRRSIKKAARRRMMRAVRRMFRGVVRTYNQLEVANKS